MRIFLGESIIEIDEALFKDFNLKKHTSSHILKPDEQFSWRDPKFDSSMSEEDYAKEAEILSKLPAGKHSNNSDPLNPRNKVFGWVFNNPKYGVEKKFKVRIPDGPTKFNPNALPELVIYSMDDKVVLTYMLLKGPRSLYNYEEQFTKELDEGKKEKIKTKKDVGNMEYNNHLFNNSVDFSALGEDVEDNSEKGKSMKTTAYDILSKIIEDEKYEKLILDEDSSDDSTSSTILTEAIETHDTLNPALWDENDNLLPEVEEGINKIVDQFVSELKDNEVDLKVIDVVLVGSNASYNYTKDSDLDVHIVADTSIIDCNYGLLPIIYNMARSSFNNKYDISIHGVPIEIYVEGTDTQATSNGIYSMKDGWIKKPVRLDIPEVDISDLYPEWEERAIEILENEDTTIEDVDQFINDIYILRRNSIATDGEYGKGNLVFKEIRNNGYLDKLKELKIKLIEKSMVIEGVEEN